MPLRKLKAKWTNNVTNEQIWKRARKKATSEKHNKRGDQLLSQNGLLRGTLEAELAKSRTGKKQRYRCTGVRVYFSNYYSAGCTKYSELKRGRERECEGEYNRERDGELCHTGPRTKHFIVISQQMIYFIFLIAKTTHLSFTDIYFNFNRSNLHVVVPG